MSSLTWQIGRKSTEQHECYESGSIKLNFSDFPAYYTTVLHKYNSPAFFARRHRRGREISQAHRRSPQNTAGDFLYKLHSALWLLKPPPGADKPNFSVQELPWEFFCSFWCIHGNNTRTVSVWGKRLHTKTSLSVGKRYLPMGKRASVTTTIVYDLTIVEKQRGL